jgi:hypothetical protein
MIESKPSNNEHEVGDKQSLKDLLFYSLTKAKIEIYQTSL